MPLPFEGLTARQKRAVTKIHSCVVALNYGILHVPVFVVHKHRICNLSVLQ
jgi:hypothetical protein